MVSQSLHKGMEEKAKGVRHEAKGIGRRECSKLKGERGEGNACASLELGGALRFRFEAGLTIHCFH